MRTLWIFYELRETPSSFTQRVFDSDKRIRHDDQREASIEVNLHKQQRLRQVGTDDDETGEQEFSFFSSWLLAMLVS